MFSKHVSSNDIYDYLWKKLQFLEGELDVYKLTDLDGALSDIAREIHKELVAKQVPADV